MSRFQYEEQIKQEISIPLGGIGTGCVGLAGNGRLIDMEIFGRPNKGSHASMSHFAVKAEREGRVLDARVLNGDYIGPRTGAYNRPDFNSYGFGVDRSTMAGFPHFRHCGFTGTFPVATLDFRDDCFPGCVTMTAWNPFIPLDDRNSSIPGAFFSFDIRNTADQPITYTIAFSMCNLLAKKGGSHLLLRQGKNNVLWLRNREKPDCSLALATDAENTSVQQYWFRGNWFDNIATYWQDFSAPGPLKNRVYNDAKGDADPNYAADDLGTLAASVSVAPGETKTVRFVLTWHVPTQSNYWNPPSAQDCGCGKCPPNQWKQYYATLFADAFDSAEYSMTQYDSLMAKTLRFRDLLFASSLPEAVLDAVSANLAVLKSPTCLRLEDGSLYGFEGCHCQGGCCEGSCTHVWNYTYAIPYLFPKLERSMRSLEYTWSMNEAGGMGFRLQLPVGRDMTSFRPCADGQFGTVMRTLREFRISGDVQWLASVWPQVKKCIAYAWSPENYDRWDADRDGILEGRQHHTLDMELFGPNAWLSGMYLGALRAGMEMAEIMGEEDTRREYEKLFLSGKEKLNRELFNGEYFFQKIDLKDRSVLEAYTTGGTMHGQSAVDGYWNEERGEIKYQIGEGSGIDQLLGQWHADLIGLGDIFDPDKVDAALHAIYQYNFIPNMRKHYNPCRLYALNDEAGLVICAWPEGKKRPFIGAPYAEETMHGFEYAAASHMIRRGMLQEGLRCVSAIRDRYDGRYRNPWNEFECGSNYARSMASYSLLLSYSGFRCDLWKGEIGFAPVLDLEDFVCFWSMETGYGLVRYEKDAVAFQIASGTVRVSALDFQKGGRIPAEVFVDGVSVSFRFDTQVRLTGRLEAQKEIRVLYR